MKKLLALVLLAGGLTLAHAQEFDANLDGLQEIPPNASPGFGSGDFSLSGTTFSVTTGSYSDLLGGSTAVTLNDAAAGSNGPLVFSLTLDNPGTTSGTFSGSGDLTAQQVTDLDAGDLYVNIRSSVFPSGEIRGQIEAVPEPSSWMLGLCAAGLLVLIRVRARR